MQQKCSTKLFILTISLVFCKLQCYENKKNAKKNEDRSQAKGEASTLKTGKLRCQTVNIHVLVFIARELNLSSVIVLHRGDFRLFILLKLRGVLEVYMTGVSDAFFWVENLHAQYFFGSSDLSHIF